MVESKISKRNIIIILSIILLITAVTVIVVWVITANAAKNSGDIESGSTPTGKYVLDESNISEIKNMETEKVPEGMFEVGMNTTWHFENGSEPSEDAYVENANTNHYPVAFDVSLEETGEVVYTSTIIPLGNQLKEIILDQSLPKGEYKAVCTYHLLDEEGKEVQQVAVGVILDIQN